MGLKRCKLTIRQQSEVIKYFVAEVTALTAANLVGINYHTAHLFYHKVRQLIAEQIEDDRVLMARLSLMKVILAAQEKEKEGVARQER